MVVEVEGDHPAQHPPTPPPTRESSSSPDLIKSTRALNGHGVRVYMDHSGREWFMRQPDLIRMVRPFSRRAGYSSRLILDLRYTRG